METGKIKFYNPTKGFGFIKRDAGGEDLFFHINNVMEGIMAEQFHLSKKKVEKVLKLEM
jgi:cold shock CspA family protein